MEWPCAMEWQHDGEEENEKDLKGSGMERTVTKIHLNELSLSTQICMNFMTIRLRRMFVL